MKHLVGKERVVGFGEIGLDLTEPEKDWHHQFQLVERLLPSVKQRHVLVVHCRGMPGDSSTAAFMLLLHRIKSVSRIQRMHLHCFTGDSYVVEKWLEAFPETYFGFTNMVEKFDRHQQEAVTRIHESRLLLETDAPYFPLPGNKWSSTNQIHRAARLVAEIRNVSVEAVLAATTEIGLRV
ncbi:hypothetical protein DPMN_122919 [Dreissena polymorpha]|uniref:Uncharacterized protein n=1 Tax=Dreissena polymorpha TaxID=45954 RepID=A0A9D4GTF3_DREPO|nr:hypothetical protein DPMN_122919 [Dreissena polymorpha]